MKKSSKTEIDLLGLFNKIQAQLDGLDKKVDTLIFRSSPENRPAPKPAVNNAPMSSRPNEQNRARQMYQAICADCQKECTIPFKPSGDRPVYCQDCFSRRKVISMSKIGVEKPQINIQESPVKKKAATAKKPIAKKKTVPKKK